MSNSENKIVLSLGGSLIYPPGGIDISFLKKFNEFIRTCLKENPKRRFFIVAGGGRVARMYQETAKEITNGAISDQDLDWLGIAGTRQNACLIRSILSDIADPEIVKDYNNLPELKREILIGGGWNPGHSTDFDAVKFADYYGADVIINLSNIGQVYDRDPRKYPDAKPIDKINWGDFIKIVGEVWTPGTNLPFDPIAAKSAQKLGKKVVILNGGDFSNLKDYLDGRKFVGTVISD